MRKPQFNMQRVSENIGGEANQKYFTDSNSIRQRESNNSHSMQNSVLNKDRKGGEMMSSITD